MNFKSNFIFLFLSVTLFELITTSSIQEKLEMYEKQVNESLLLEKQDKININSWSEDLQVQMVNVTTKYRLQMTRHLQHSFKKKTRNEKWHACLNLYHNYTTKSEQEYYIRENECLRNASSSDEGKRQAVMQVGREIRKWRRSYRYLANLCHRNNPNNEDQTAICLVSYMERDNYTHTFERLINLRLHSVQELHSEMVSSVTTLEDCLRTTLSRYLDKVRQTMEVLNKCYGN